MKFTLLASAPAIVMTILSACALRAHPNSVANDAFCLGMFASWCVSSALVVAYRAARIVRLAARKPQL